MITIVEQTFNFSRLFSGYMTTRSGCSYKQHKEMLAESFERMLQTLMDDWHKREEEIAAEHAQREKEVQTQMDMMKEQK